MPCHLPVRLLAAPLSLILASAETGGGGQERVLPEREPGTTADARDCVYSMRYVTVDEPERYRLRILTPDGSVTWTMPILGRAQPGAEAAATTPATGR